MGLKGFNFSFKYSYFCRCVSKVSCDISNRGTTLIRKGFTFSQLALAEEATCIDPVNEICCNEKEVIKKQDDMTCSEIADKGFRYLSK